MRVLVDADACPVTDLTISIARKNGLEVVLICDEAHELHREGASTVTVSKGADSADFYLVNLIKAGDVVITQDYGLAAMCLARRAYALNQNGLIYTAENIDALLFQRHESRKWRMSGHHTKGPQKRQRADDEAFAQAFSGLLSQALKPTGTVL